MINILSKLKINSRKEKKIEPRDIFMSLPAKDKCYEYPRDVQTEVWQKWYVSRNNKDNIIKMNTGSGKTVVGLIILQSCLNEGIGPAIYVTPDKYLCDQVCNEAQKLGIKTTKDRDDFSYTEKDSILVMPIHALVNAKSVFGMRSGGNNYPIGSILIDDVHTCLETIVSKFSIKIDNTHELYSKLVELFRNDWIKYNDQSFNDIIVMQDPSKQFYIPFWIWQEKHSEIYKLLKEHDNNSNEFIFFSLELIKDSLMLSDCFITSTSIEIIPKGIAIDKITEFEKAKRRIFMSATLSDDGVFISSIGLDSNRINNIITPSKANDIGDRLILFPQYINSSITAEEIQTKVREISKKYNVIVIVPSIKQCESWTYDNTEIINKTNISDEIEKLKKEHLGLRILVNRYDGIDLPDDACRLLVIDGLPPLKNELEKYLQGINPNYENIIREQINRIEQGMGRGVRSNSDSCCIIFMGNKLTDVIIRKEGFEFFSNATKEQYLLSKKIWKLLLEDNDKPGIDNIFELADYSLERSLDWVKQSKECLSGIEYLTIPNFDEITIALRKAFCSERQGKINDSIKVLTDIINITKDPSTKGYLMQVKAEYMNILNQLEAQKILKSACNYNNSLLKPINGLEYKHLEKCGERVNVIKSYISQFIERKDCIIHIKSVLDDLEFSQNTDQFESALKEIGEFLGFTSLRPDKETGGKGPDNLWGIEDNLFYVIECKSGAKETSFISKDYCNQLGGSIRWFYDNYGKNKKAIPILIHPSNNLHNLATKVDNMRIMTPECLLKLKNNIVSFVNLLSLESDNSSIMNLLKTFNLDKDKFINMYSEEPIVQK